MDAEEFLGYVGQAYYYRDKGTARLNRARRHYKAYASAYCAKSMAELVGLGFDRVTRLTVLKAAEDRDAGRPMVSVPELL